MTNSAMRAIIEEFGDRICMIIFDNNVKVYIGYPSSTLKNVNEIKFASFDGVDMIGIPKAIGDPKAERIGVTSTIWHPTGCIQMIATVDEGYEKFRIDPMTIG